MRHDKFACFILSNGRPNHVLTYEKLRKHGYTGRIFLICDDEDESLPEYRNQFDDVLVFSKAEAARQFDSGANFLDRRGVVYARNMCHMLAKQQGLRYFLELDDDYVYFKFRVDDRLKWHSADVLNLDNIFDLYIDFLESNDRILSVAFAQGGDYIGGANSPMIEKMGPLRKVMNSFFCKVDKPFKFYGRINEDTMMYTLLGGRGHLFFTIPHIGLDQIQTQMNPGGLTDQYLDCGTYVKSFYTVMYCPSACIVAPMSGGGSVAPRLHHHVKWRYAVPKILRESVKK